MTILIATIGDGFALLSQDTFVAPASSVLAGVIDPSGESPGAITRDWAGAAGRDFEGDGTPPDIAPICWASKIIALPHLHGVMGASGGLGPYLRYAANVIGTLRVTDVAELDGFAPTILSQAHEADPAAGGALVMLQLGWIAAEHRVAGFAYSSVDGFASVPLTEGHSMMPIVDTADRHYAAIRDAWTPALGDPAAAAEFHDACARNQFAAYRAGRFPNGIGIGGALITARVDSAGIQLTKRTGVFEDAPGGPP